jgi:hypothetical protein
MFGSPSALFGSILFGAIGFAAFLYGRRMAAWKPIVIGVGLMAFPYFVDRTWALYTIGCALCMALYLFRD